MSASAGPDLITDGLVLHLDAADPKSYNGSGATWFDRSGNGYNATLTNVTYQVENKGNFSLSTSSYIDLNRTPLQVSSPDGSVSIWFKTDSLNRSQEIFYTKENRDIAIYIYDDGSGYKYYASAYNGTTGDYEIVGGQTITTDWVNIVFTYTQNNGSNAVYKIYFNGELLDEEITSTTTDAPVGLYSRIGGSAFGGGNQNYPAVDYFSGNVAQFLVYNEVISSSTVKQNYNATKSRFQL